METISVLGVALELRQIAPPLPAAGTAARAPIVFLHEGLGSVAQWQGKGGYWPAQVCAATGRAGWVYSRQGYGQSDTVVDVRGPSRGLNGQRQGRLQPDYLHREAYVVLPELLRLLGIERPVLLGHSDGGSIALLYASRFAVEACVVLAPHVLVEDISLRAIAAARDAYLASTHAPSGLRQRLARYHHDVDCAFWQWNDVWLSEGFRNFDIRAECSRITAPVLAIQGHEDPYGSMLQIDAIAQALEAAPDASIRSIKGPQCPPNVRVQLQKLEHCGHAPHKDQSAQSWQCVSEFLAPLG